MRASAVSVLWLIWGADLSARDSRPCAPKDKGTIIAAATPIAAKPGTIRFFIILSHPVFHLEFYDFSRPAPSRRLLDEMPDHSEPLYHQHGEPRCPRPIEDISARWPISRYPSRQPTRPRRQRPIPDQDRRRAPPRHTCCDHSSHRLRAAESTRG